MQLVVLSSDKASALAKTLALPCVTTFSSTDTHVLEFKNGHLQLRSLKKQASLTVFVDFLQGALAHRASKSSAHSEMLARAVNVKKYTKVLDATAGLGRDAFILAHLGCHVTLLESSPVVAALLQDGLKRAQGLPSIERMILFETDSIPYMQAHSEAFDVVYLDPMFPTKSKTALVKKEMQLLHDVVSTSYDGNALFQAAWACAKHRVVVKRPRLSQCLVTKAPHFTYEGRSSRFDIYLKS